MPELREDARSGVSFLTDDALFDACGVRIAFTGRKGGSSVAPFDQLNLGTHVGDNSETVLQNRQLALRAIGAAGAKVIALNQVHGNNVLYVASSDPYCLAKAREQAAVGADAVVVNATDAAGVAPVLCFADCVPLIAVCPSGDFAVIHAGWRGVMSGVAPRAVQMLAELQVSQYNCENAQAAAAEMNVYIGPHIGACCFQTGEDVRRDFADRFGETVLSGNGCVDLSAAFQADLESEGVDVRRIADCGICTVCNSQDYYSYRASSGLCGRHAAIAVRVR